MRKLERKHTRHREEGKQLHRVILTTADLSEITAVLQNGSLFTHLADDAMREDQCKKCMNFVHPRFW
jgi:hypothetical protein